MKSKLPSLIARTTREAFSIWLVMITGVWGNVDLTHVRRSNGSISCICRSRTITSHGWSFNSLKTSFPGVQEYVVYDVARASRRNCRHFPSGSTMYILRMNTASYLERGQPHSMWDFTQPRGKDPSRPFGRVAAPSSLRPSFRSSVPPEPNLSFPAPVLWLDGTPPVPGESLVPDNKPIQDGSGIPDAWGPSRSPL